MRTRTALCFALLGIGFIHAQSAHQLLHPEHLAGRWEAPDGKGGEVGMNILISTTVPGSATSLTGVSQKLEKFEIGVYRRSRSEADPRSFNFFTTSANGGATWDGRRLRINLQPQGHLPGIHVDLAWSATVQTWTGTFGRAAFSNQAITLKRPTSPRNNQFVGSWFHRGGLADNCLHIVQARDETLTGWSDDIQIPGRIRYPKDLHPPARAIENYGEMAKVKMTGTNRIVVELWAYTPMCCSHPFSAAISRKGKSFVSAWATARPVEWIRVQSNSCISSADRP